MFSDYHRSLKSYRTSRAPRYPESWRNQSFLSVEDDGNSNRWYRSAVVRVGGTSQRCRNFLRAHCGRKANSKGKQGQNSGEPHCTSATTPATHAHASTSSFEREESRSGALRLRHFQSPADRNLCQWMLPPLADLIRRELAENVKNSY